MIRFLFVESDGMDTILPKMIDSCLSYSKEAETNWADLSIANSICLCLFGIVFVCVAGFIIWQVIEISAKRKNDLCRHNWDFKNRKYEEKIKLIERLLDYLKAKAEKSDSKPKNGNSLEKVDEICSCLTEAAAKLCGEDFRQRCINLCVSMKTQKELEAHKAKDKDIVQKEVKTHCEEVLRCLSEHIPDLNKEEINKILECCVTKQDTGESSINNDDFYKSALICLIGIIEKEKIEFQDINNLKTACGVKVN